MSSSAPVVAQAHDQDLAPHAESVGSTLEQLGRLERSAVPAHFGFDPDPSPRGRVRWQRRIADPRKG